MSGFQRQISPPDLEQTLNHAHDQNQSAGGGGGSGELNFYSYFCCPSIIQEHGLHCAGDVQEEIPYYMHSPGPWRAQRLLGLGKASGTRNSCWDWRATGKLLAGTGVV